MQGETDLVEEVCRIIGLDQVPATPMERLHAVARPVLNAVAEAHGGGSGALPARGLNEAVTWSFLAENQARLFGGGQPELKLANPISSELSDMRPSLLPNLIAAAGRNMARGFADIGLFEVGQAYAGDRPEEETVRAAGSPARGGRAAPLGGPRRAPSMSSTSRPMPGGAGGGLSTCRQYPDRCRRPALVSSRTLRNDPDRAEEQAWLVSAKSIPACCRRWM